MLHIGMIGPPLLLRQNAEIFQQELFQQEQFQPPIEAFPVRTAQQLAKLDGLLITGQRPEDCAQQLYRLHTALKEQRDTLSLLGIAAGAAALGENQLLPLLHCQTLCKPTPCYSTSMLEVPCFARNRFAAWFLPEVRFFDLAPCMGVLCQHPHRGPVIIRQGDVLACSYMAEWTAQKEIYQYWLEMVTALKNSQEES